jgi:DNA-binding transcriptional MerR regulator
MMSSNPTVQSPETQQNKVQPTFRAGAVARMAGMPVATLRIWEQRYQAVRPNTAASGHRLYSLADVERATLLRRLTAQGHAIGLLAALDTDQMRGMMHMSETGSPEKMLNASLRTSMRAVVVGQAFAGRLNRIFERQPFGSKLQIVAVFDSLFEATQAAQHAVQPSVDLLLWQAVSLQPGAGNELRDAQDAWQAPAAAVVYRFSSSAGRAELTGAGARALYEPADDDSLAEWLSSLKPAEPTQVKAAATCDPSSSGAANLNDITVLPPRFDESALTNFAGLSTSVACECPSHLAQLLLQVSYFEKYSGECANRSSADAQLHAYLQQVAGTARMLFEKALEQVAIAEGLPLPVVPVVSLTQGA